MGIHGLMSYVGEHKQFFTDLQLRNTKIIIDGNNLFHRLYFESNLDLQHGGDYDSFTDIVHKFFETLSVCKIYPYVVLDGGCDLSDKKFVTLKERARDKIQVAYSISRGGGGSVLPLLTREVFKQVLTKLEVPFVQCFSEADRDIMSLANHWNCPVLTLDSDFCIFDLKAGYCPLNYFQWRNLCTCEGTLDCYIPARCFSLERLCSHFSHMNKALLPLFAVMNGNDYINLPALETFFSKVPRSVQLKLLLETLGVKASILQPIPSPLWLPVAVTCYWTRYSEPKVKLHHLQALLLGMVFGELHRTSSSPDPVIFSVKDDKMVYDQFLKWKEKNFQKLLDLDTAHTFCQWQCCLQMGLHLNQLLSTPLTEPDLTRLYCGTLVHRLCKELKSVHAAENLLISSPKMSQLYCDLLHAVKSTVPPDFFQETTKTTKSFKEKNKQATSQAETIRQHATLEAQPLCDVNNRFASLMVED
ncbi:protein asteroid homolog 1 isoform X4 [Dermochelys coriacea]|uniref:protein asteroid homolog 1 isoform X4 n=1 Tax=Dermochelys coriacea TaxID=27794 RepID=UPI0018E77D83|nr:protein asteroid homolog 1 isoform X4 [Dermochelys coriacea]